MGWGLTISATCDLGGPEPFYVEVYEGGNTFNVFPMFGACGAAAPREWPLACTDAIPVLEDAIAKFKANRPALEALNPVNGWGSYEGTVAWMEEILAACRKAPLAKLEVT